MDLTDAEATARAQLLEQIAHVTATNAGDPARPETWRRAYLTSASVAALAARMAALPAPSESQAEAAALLDALLGLIGPETPPGTRIAHVPVHTARVVLAVLSDGEKD